MKSEFIDLRSYDRVAGQVVLPGSKSISNRVLLLAALAKGNTVIHGLLESEDTHNMVDSLMNLGVNFDWQTNGSLQVSGCSGSIRQKSCSLFVGNAGTVIRPLTAVLAILGGEFRIHGVERMHERPIEDLVENRGLAAIVDSWTYR